MRTWGAATNYKVKYRKLHWESREFSSRNPQTTPDTTSSVDRCVAAHAHASLCLSQLNASVECHFTPTHQHPAGRPNCSGGFISYVLGRCKIRQKCFASTVRLINYLPIGSNTPDIHLKSSIHSEHNSRPLLGLVPHACPLWHHTSVLTPLTFTRNSDRSSPVIIPHSPRKPNQSPSTP